MSSSSLLEMPFLEHLKELRGRLIRIIIAVVILSIFAFYYSELFFSLLTTPLFKSFDGVELIGTGPSEAFIIKLKVAFVVGSILSSPITFFEFWRFVAPGLYPKEQRYAIPFVLFATMFFLSGITFCYCLVLPFAFQFFSAEFASIGIKPSIRIGEYLSFATTILLVFGAIFEMPIFAFILARLKLLSSKWLIEKGRYAIVVIFIVAGILTPPDPITQTLLAIPLLILYGLCILITKLAYPKDTSNLPLNT